MSPRDQRGTALVLMPFLVLAALGVGALVVDVGAVYTEGRQLQNGAEAAALAIARTCADGSCDATAGDAVANGDATDGTSLVEVVCGTATSTPCSTPGTRDRFGCRPVTGTAPYVQVQTRTVSGDGSTNLVPPGLIRVVDPDFPGTSVTACARAAYGSVSGLSGELPLAISECEFNYWLDAFGLVEAPYPVTAEAVLFFHDTGGAGPSDCPDRSNDNANQDDPGGFGWLTTTDSCSVYSTLDGDAYEDQGNNVPGACDASNFAAMLGQVVHVPIYATVADDPTDDTNLAVYDVVGHASFFLTGYRLSGNPAYVHRSPGIEEYCPSSSSRCISGFFTTDTLTASGPLLPPTGYGTTAVRLVG